MGSITRVDGSRTRVLLPELLVGRSSLCGLRLDGPDVSKEHAVIRWNGTAWELRDLNSRNGTFAAGRRLEAEQRVVLESGLELCFGSEERWILEDLAPPRLSARTVDAGEALVLTGQQLLAFGDDDHVLASIYRDGRGRWVLEHDGKVQPIQNQATLDLANRRWVVELPEHIDPTAEPGSTAFIRRATLSFRTSAKAPVGLQVKFDDKVYDLKRRGHHLLTLALAQRRLADRAKGVEESKQGWIDYRALQQTLDCTRNLVNVNVHRARKQLEDAGFADAACIVERRLSSGELRIGVGALEILADPALDPS